MRGTPYVHVVVVRDGIRYDCEFQKLKSKDTWRCGACRKGSLGFLPVRTEHCRNCGALVDSIVHRQYASGYQALSRHVSPDNH